MVLKYWSTNPDGSGDRYEQGDKISVPGRNITLYAHWSRMETRVLFYPNQQYAKVRRHLLKFRNRHRILPSIYLVPNVHKALMYQLQLVFQNRSRSFCNLDNRSYC